MARVRLIHTSDSSSESGSESGSRALILDSGSESGSESGAQGLILDSGSESGSESGAPGLLLDHALFSSDSRPGRKRIRARLGLVLALLVGCGGDSAPEPIVRDPFIAMQSDFADLFDWPRWSVPDIGSKHGHRRGEPSWIYVRGQIPPWGEPMPVGTIIAKSVEVGEPGEWEIHAMVKRGGGFNADGCAEWEWLDLRLNENRVPVITWRGEGNAANPGGYGRRLDGTPISCNDCHAQVPHTDYTFARALYTPED